MRDIHHAKNGQLAFADLLYIPASHSLCAVPIPKGEGFLCGDPQRLHQQNRSLAAVCEERLQEIHSISHAAQERLQVIEVLDREVKSLRAELAKAIKVK